MDRIELPSWSEFKAVCITRKNLNCQYGERDSAYDLMGPDSGALLWCYTLPKDGGADHTDFEDNHKAAFNWAIPSRAYAFSTSDFEFAPQAALDTCTAGSTKAVLLAMDGTKYMNGGKLITDGHGAFGDWVSADVIDHDNLLGYGVDTVLKTWIQKWYVDAKACEDTIVTPYAGKPPAGMYLRLTYHSVGATDVGFALNLLVHKAI